MNNGPSVRGRPPCRRCWASFRWFRWRVIGWFIGIAPPAKARSERGLIARGLYAEGLTLVEIAAEFGVANRPCKHPPVAYGTE